MPPAFSDSIPDTFKKHKARPGDATAVERVLCVLVVSRGGTVLVNYWPHPDGLAERLKGLEWETPSVAKLVAGYQQLLGHPPSCDMTLALATKNPGPAAATAGAAPSAAVRFYVSNSARCTVAVAVRDSVAAAAAAAAAHHRGGFAPGGHATEQGRLRALALHLSAACEWGCAAPLAAQAQEDERRRQADDSLTAEQILANTTLPGPLVPPTPERYAGFEAVAHRSLVDATATLCTLVRSLVTEDVFLASAFNPDTGEDYCSFTAAALPWALDKNLEELLREARTGGSATASALRGLSTSCRSSDAGSASGAAATACGGGAGVGAAATPQTTLGAGLGGGGTTAARTFGIREWYRLRGLYHTGSGVVWKLVADRCSTAAAAAAAAVGGGGGGGVKLLRIAAGSGTKVEVLTAQESVWWQGALAPCCVAVFLVPQRAAAGGHFVDLVDLALPVVSVASEALSETSIAHKAFLSTVLHIAELPGASGRRAEGGKGVPRGNPLEAPRRPR